jgi:hypothetical protein
LCFAYCRLTKKKKVSAYETKNQHGRRTTEEALEPSVAGEAGALTQNEEAGSSITAQVENKAERPAEEEVGVHQDRVTRQAQIERQEAHEKEVLTRLRQISTELEFMNGA